MNDKVVLFKFSKSANSNKKKNWEKCTKKWKIIIKKSWGKWNTLKHLHCFFFFRVLWLCLEAWVMRKSNQSCQETMIRRLVYSIDLIRKLAAVVVVRGEKKTKGLTTFQQHQVGAPTFVTNGKHLWLFPVNLPLSVLSLTFFIFIWKIRRRQIFLATNEHQWSNEGNDEWSASFPCR